MLFRSTSAARYYYEGRHAAGPSRANLRIEVPTGCAVFPKEVLYSPRKWVEARYNLRQFTVMPQGGHFAALEQPELLVNDVRALFRDLRAR